MPILVLILSDGPGCANHCKSDGRENRILHFSSCERYVVWVNNYRFYNALCGMGELSKIAQSQIPAGYNPGSPYSHGLIMLYLGGRMGVPSTRLRAVYLRSFRRYIRGIRS